MDIILRDISKNFGEKRVLSGLYADFREGGVSCLVGPSGCGKTTVFNIIAGLLSPDSGSISGLEGKTVSYAFQEPRLLPWKTVRENIDFVLKDLLSPEERSRRISKWLKAVHLEESANLLPSQLSGGMAQRVSLARAFALEADIILLDEPFNGIDGELKSEMISTLKDFWAASGTTVLLITHNYSEAAALGAQTIPLG